MTDSPQSPPPPAKQVDTPSPAGPKAAASSPAELKAAAINIGPQVSAERRAQEIQTAKDELGITALEVGLKNLGEVTAHLGNQLLHGKSAPKGLVEWLKSMLP